MDFIDGMTVFSVLIGAPSEGPMHPGLSARLCLTQMVVINREHNQSDYRAAVSGEMLQATVS